MLRVFNLSKTYDTKTGVKHKALDGVTLSFQKTGMVFIFGKSGSGKSTLLNILGGLDKADHGYVEIEGKSSEHFTARDYDSYRNTYLGFVFQDFNVLPDFTARENIQLAYQLQHQEINPTHIDEILNQVEMSNVSNRYPNELSGGQIQRISIARALVKNPRMIMADEPTGNLDSETGDQVFRILKQLSSEKLVIVVSHDLEAANKYADRIIELKDGKVIADQTRKANHQSQFEDTQGIDQGEIPEELKLISSKLPHRIAYQMGKKSLNNKKGRLVLSLLLAIISITLFALSDVISHFTVTKASYNTYQQSNYNILPFVEEKDVEDAQYTEKIPPTPERVAYFEALSNRDVYLGYHYNIEFYEIIHNDIPYYNNYYIQFISGIIELPDEFAIQDDFVGRFPEHMDEFIINNYLLEHFIDYGFEYYDTDTETIEYLDNVTSFEDVQGRIVKLRIGMNYTYLKIVGMINYDLTKYHALKEVWNQVTEHTSYEDIKAIDFSADQYAFLGRIVVLEGFNQANYIQNLSQNSFSVENLGNHQDINIELIDLVPPEGLGDEERHDFLNKEHIDFSKFKIIDTDHYYFGSHGVPTGLGELNVIVPSSWFPVSQESELDQYLNTKIMFKLVTNDAANDNYQQVDVQKELNIVGFYTGDYYYMNYNIVVPDSVFDEIISLTVNNAELMFTYLHHDLTDANFFSLLDHEGFKHYTSLSEGIYRVTNLFGVIKKLFLYVALIMLCLAILMMMSYIYTSVIYKQKDIGILRALGARKNDVIKIFLFEGLIMAIICYIFVIICSIIGIQLFNHFIKSAMQTDTVLVNLGIRQILLVAVICFLTISLASYYPVNKIANKMPIDAIKER